jgi:AraC family transcriptional regulator
MANNESPDIPSNRTVLPSIHIVGDVVKKAGSLGPRQLPDYELLYFPNASATVYQVGEEEYTLKQPCFIISRPQETHVYRYDPVLPSRHLFIHFGYDTEPSYVPPLAVLQAAGPSCVPLESELLVGMLKQILYIAYSFPDQLQQRGSALLNSLLLEIDGHFSDRRSVDSASRVHPQIAKALDYIEKHLQEPLSVNMLANTVGWTHEHFSRSFVRQTGRTPREMIIHRRIERACQLLLYEDWNIRRVAHAVGFIDENYFFRVFRMVRGITPSEYRKKYYHPRYRGLFPASETDSAYPPNRILYNAYNAGERNKI